MHRYRLWPVCLIGFAVSSTLCSLDSNAADLGSLRVMQDQYPRVFFFRAVESLASNPRVSYERWDKACRRLMGIEGKVLDEEIPGRSKRNIDFFTRFKREHPDQLVLLHYNGNSRDPRFEAQKFFAGHFIYYNGAKILEDIPAEEGETDIKVDNPALFQTEMGRYKWSNDDIGLCVLDDHGRPDWNRSEQVQLVSIDARQSTIRVKRASYGTKPIAFSAGKSYAAAHATEGPWGKKSNILWYYNYSTRCPRDPAGRTCNDIHAEELSARFLPGGRLEAFDGLEFDVLHHEHGSGRTRGLDCDADGLIDNGVFDGVNQYGIGVVEFCRRLRERMGPHRLILADGMSARNQRAFAILNGIESEGWPTLSDWQINDWSGGLNRHLFWAENGAQPIFNYVNHKFTTAGPTPGSRVTPDVPFAVSRLVFASCMFTDSAICYSFSPPKERTEMLGIWDELRKGSENELGWLGRPLHPPVRLARREPDVLEGRGSPLTTQLAKRFTGDSVRFSLEDGRLTVSGNDPDAASIRFQLADVPAGSPDLFVSVTVDAQQRKNQPPEIARRIWVGTAPPRGQLILSELPTAGICLRGQAEQASEPDTGGYLRWAPNVELGGQRRDCYATHPPYRAGVGYSFWQRQADVPQEGRLVFLTGMGSKSPQRSDGVWFRVLLADLTDTKNERPVEYRQIFEHSQKESRWMPHEVSLADWAGRRVSLKFVADCGPHDNSTTDHAYWADAAVVGPQGREEWTAPVEHMTWLNAREFTSTFYFKNVCSPAIDLRFSVEGTEPIRITSIAAHRHPDAIYREFQHGLVLANPAPRPYTFDLDKLLPGQKFRRLQGTPLQDPEANNGSPAPGKLTLGPNEGLFLAKTTQTKR